MLKVEPPAKQKSPPRRKAKTRKRSNGLPIHLYLCQHSGQLPCPTFETKVAAVKTTEASTTEATAIHLRIKSPHSCFRQGYSRAWPISMDRFVKGIIPEETLLFGFLEILCRASPGRHLSDSLNATDFTSFACVFQG